MGRKPKGTNDVRENILKAAEGMFAAKGYDGTSVDEIANQLGINKPLIYYYFNSKREILKEIIERFVQYIITSKDFLIRESGEVSQSFLGKYAGLGIELMEDKKDILRIILMESLKGDSKDHYIFDMLETAFYEVFENDRLEKPQEELMNKLKMIVMFFGIAPIFFYHTLGDKWAAFYSQNREDFEVNFKKLYEDIYIKQISEFFTS